MFIVIITLDTLCIHLFYVLGSPREVMTISELMINEQIRCKEVRVIGEAGDQLGVMPIMDARKLAEEAGVDLVMIQPKA